MFPAQVRAMEPLSPDVFDGVDWAFILAPLSRDRLKRGTMMIDAAVAAGVSQAILLSVIGAGTCGERNASKLWQYWALEQTVHERFGPGGVVLRTYFYQQNLAFWAEDAVATGGSLRLPLRNHTGFCPLHQKDVAAVAAEIAKNHNVRPDHAGQTFNLTGPESLNGRELAMVASDAIGRPMEYRDVGRREAMAILDATGQVCNALPCCSSQVAQSALHPFSPQSPSGLVHPSG